MEWTDAAIILAVRPHGERGAVVSALSAGHGRWMGRVTAAQMGKKPWLCAGTLAQTSWHARLEDRLGTFALEPLHHAAAHVFDDAAALLALDYVCALTAEVTPERLPLPLLFEALRTCLAAPTAKSDIAYERKLLDAMGYGLDLSSCAVTGTTENLTHISPNTGKAVCATEAAPYMSKLLPLPAYWVDMSQPADLSAGARVTGHFLSQHFYMPPKQLPVQRQQLLSVTIGASNVVP